MPPLDSMLDGTIRQPAPLAEPDAEPWSGWADDDKPPPGSTIVEVDDDGKVRVIELGRDDTPPRDNGFDENLAEREELQGELGIIADDLIQGIEADIRSRSGFIANYTRGLDLLGIANEEPNTHRGAGKGSSRKVSTLRDSTMLESVVKAQSQARGELLPASGPAKVREVPGASEEDDELASDFEEDFNLALTKGMPEFVPDLDRGLFGFFYGGNMFRYGYHDPITERPRVDTVGVEDLIVSEEATSLETATRWTIRMTVSPTQVKYKQYYGIWRECEMGIPLPSTDQIEQKKNQIAGVTSQGQRPQDQPYEIYSTVTDLDLAIYGIKEKGAPRGRQLPYRVTVEKHSRQILRIERFWKAGDKRFQRKRRCIHYGMVPGFGFLAYGFLHLQGNSVATLTAVIRQLVDAMLFGNFPGGVKIKGARTEESQVEPSPGEFVDIAVPANTTSIRDAIMALPYKDVSPVAIQLYEMVQQACQRVGAAAQLEVGEGRGNTPVGTIMAMLEEKTVVMGAIHKRLHEAMSQELSMIRDLFMERPESLEKVLESPKRAWAAKQEFANLDLVPASDPNIPSQVHRVMLATALATLAQMPTFTQRLDMDDILKRILRMVGISDPDRIVVQPPPQSGTDPGAAQAQASIQVAQMKNMQAEKEGQRKAATTLEQTQQRERESNLQAQNDAADRASKEKIELMNLQMEKMRLDSDVQKEQLAHQHAMAQIAQTDQHHAQDQQMQHHQMALQSHESQQQREMQAQQAQQKPQAQKPQGQSHGASDGGERSFGSKSI
jgi:hypothetical protein